MDKLLEDGIIAFYKGLNRELMPLVNDELKEVLPNEHWQKLQGFNWGSVAIHTINVVYRSIENPIYQDQCSPWE